MTKFRNWLTDQFLNLLPVSKFIHIQGRTQELTEGVLYRKEVYRKCFWNY